MYSQVSDGVRRNRHIQEYRKRTGKAKSLKVGENPNPENGNSAKPVRPYLLTRFRTRRNDAFKAISKDDYRDLCKGVKAFAKKQGVANLKLPKTFGMEFFKTVNEDLLCNTLHELSIVEFDGKKCLQVKDFELNMFDDVPDSYQPLMAGGIWKIPNGKVAEICKDAIKQLSAITPLTRATDCIYPSLVEYIIENEEEEEEELVQTAKEINDFFENEMKEIDKYKELCPKTCPRDILEQKINDVLAEETLSDKERSLMSFLLDNIDTFYDHIEEMDCQNYANVQICEYDFFPIFIGNDTYDLLETALWMTQGEVVGGDMAITAPPYEYIILPDGEDVETGKILTFKLLLKDLSEKLSKF